MEILVSEPPTGRRARAEDHGFPHLRAPGEVRDVARDVRGLTGAGADIVVDCSGAVPALEAAPEMTKRGGRIVIAGIPKQPVPVDAGRMVLFERSLIATLGYANDLPRVAAMIAAGNLARGDDHPADLPRGDAGGDRPPGGGPGGRRQGPGRGRSVSGVGPVSANLATVMVPMPHMGVSVEEGTVIEWLKRSARR